MPTDRTDWRSLDVFQSDGYVTLCFPMMPWCIGSGTTFEEAYASLQKVAATWIVVFGEANGLPALAERLTLGKHHARHPGGPDDRR